LDLRPEYFDKNLPALQKRWQRKAPHLGGFERRPILILPILRLYLLMACRAALNHANMTFENCLTKEVKRRGLTPAAPHVGSCRPADKDFVPISHVALIRNFNIKLP